MKKKLCNRGERGGGEGEVCGKVDPFGEPQLKVN